MATVAVGTSTTIPSIHTFPQQQKQDLLPNDQHIVFWSFVAGALTGGIEAFCTYPIEYVKTNLQLQQISSHGVSLTSSSSSSSVAGQSHVYSGMWDCVRTTVRNHSPSGLYRGFTPVLLGSIPKQASRWAAYEWATETAAAFLTTTTTIIQNRNIISSSSSNVDMIKQRKTVKEKEKNHASKLSLSILSACGFFAGCVEAVCAVAPAESVKTRLIQDAKRPSPHYSSLSTVRAVQLMLRENGVRRTFYSGVGTTMLKQGLNQAMRFPVQKLCMDVFCYGPAIAVFPSTTNNNNNNNSNNNNSGGSVGSLSWQCEERRHNPLWNGVAGFCAGVVSVLITQPVDVVKTHLQSGIVLPHTVNNNNNNNNNNIKKSYPVRGSCIGCYQTIYRERGFAGFYAGVIARSVHVGAHVALTFTVFPVIRQAVLGTSCA